MRDKLKKIAAQVRRLPPPDLRDVLCFGGLGFVFYGLHQFAPPLAWVVVGGALFWLSLRSANGTA